jgi:hypothetical protein
MSRLELENLMTKVRLYVQMVSGEFWIFGATAQTITRSLSSLFILLLSYFLFSLLNPLAIHLVHE